MSWHRPRREVEQTGMWACTRVDTGPKTIYVPPLSVGYAAELPFSMGPYQRLPSRFVMQFFAHVDTRFSPWEDDLDYGMQHYPSRFKRIRDYLQPNELQNNWIHVTLFGEQYPPNPAPADGYALQMGNELKVWMITQPFWWGPGAPPKQNRIILVPGGAGPGGNYWDGRLYAFHNRTTSTDWSAAMGSTYTWLPQRSTGWTPPPYSFWPGQKVA